MKRMTAARRNPIGQLRFFAGTAVAMTGAGLWLADMAHLIA